MLNLKFLLKRFVVDFLVIMLGVMSFSPLYSIHGVLAAAEGFTVDETTGLSYPYTRMFSISAYYSPLPCQQRYATGSYEGDIRLNGNGTNGADGTPVYPGMIAAPKSYSFGTKIYIPGVGITAVHDRGGAIVQGSEADGYYDRLDIWMGYGDVGLNRALQWGKRSVETTVYGINNGITEQINLDGFSNAESIPGDCTIVTTASEVYEPVAVPSVVSEPSVDAIIEPTIEPSDPLTVDLQIGDSNAAVTKLQNELTAFNYYRGPITGYYGELTEHAVFKFQQSQSLLGDIDTPGAGIFGPRTRDRLNELIANRRYTKVLVASSTVTNTITNNFSNGDSERDVPFSDGFELDIQEDGILLTKELDLGASGPEVVELQKFLQNQGFFDGLLVTNYFGPMTEIAVLDFQLAFEVISSVDDLGAGRVGPKTLNLINSLS